MLLQFFAAVELSHTLSPSTIDPILYVNIHRDNFLTQRPGGSAWRRTRPNYRYRTTHRLLQLGYGDSVFCVLSPTKLCRLQSLN